MKELLIRYQAANLAAFQQQRDGETRLGETLLLPDPTLPLADALRLAKKAGAVYVLLGIPEDIGPRANLGNGGADLGFQAFLKRFLNLQANDFIDGDQILLLGEVNLADLQQQSAGLQANKNEDLVELRQLCAKVDERATPVLKAIFDAGLTPLVIGGGHNNALPLLTALSQSCGSSVNAVNLDPHCDFRLLEGRHSGNGFSYAKAQGHLNRYFVLGLHELKNSKASLAQLKHADAAFCSYQQIYLHQQYSFPQAIAAAIQFVSNTDQPLGIELDTDSISMMPVSAFTNCGISVREAELYVYQLAKLPQSRYLHLAEAAPAQHPAGLAAGMSEAGQVLTALVLAFIQARNK